MVTDAIIGENSARDIPPRDIPPRDIPQSAIFPRVPLLRAYAAACVFLVFRYFR